MLFKKLASIAVLAGTAFASAPSLVAQSESAAELFAHAKAEAQQQHKNVLMVFSASWCGPCHLYERFLEDPEMAAITDKAFVVVRVDVGERANDSQHADTPGGTDLRASLGAVQEPGFPFIVVTDPGGKPIINSYRKGNTSANIGYPVLPEEIDWYIVMLKRAAPSISKDELSATRIWLKQHAPR